MFNVIQNRNNIALPLFFVDLQPSENNEGIYQMEILNYTKVKLEPPRPKRNVLQCSKCQRYGRTQAYCYHSPRRVKCADSHPTKQFPRKYQSDNVKCVLCDGNHPAVYKDIQNRTFPPLRNKNGGKNQKFLTQTPVRLDISHAYIFKSQHNQCETTTAQTHQQIPYQQQPQPPTSDIQELKVMMKGLMEQMSTMLSLLTTRVSKTA